MYSVYKITNLINQKCYIGSSIQVEKRWQQEKNSAFNPKSNSYQYPLSQAFRKYGLKNFSFEILKNDFDTVQEMQEYEHEMIHFYNALKNGYNQTDYTTNILQDPILRQKIIEQKGQKCALVDIDETILEEFPSYQEASRKCFNTKDNASRIRKVCLGENSSVNGLIFRLIDSNNNIISKPLLPYKNRKKIIGIDPSIKKQNIYFDSILAASQQLKVDRSSIQKCLNGENRYSIVGGYIFRELDINNNIIKNNIDIEEKIKEYEQTHPIINNEQHSITDWCKIYNISRNCFYKRIQKGMSIVEAITLPKRR